MSRYVSNKMIIEIGQIEAGITTFEVPGTFSAMDGEINS